VAAASFVRRRGLSDLRRVIVEDIQLFVGFVERQHERARGDAAASSFQQVGDDLDDQTPAC
jgi:hypothetical protein